MGRLHVECRLCWQDPTASCVNGYCEHHCTTLCLAGRAGACTPEVTA